MRYIITKLIRNALVVILSVGALTVSLSASIITENPANIAFFDNYKPVYMRALDKEGQELEIVKSTFAGFSTHENFLLDNKLETRRFKDDEGREIRLGGIEEALNVAEPIENDSKKYVFAGFVDSQEELVIKSNFEGKASKKLADGKLDANGVTLEDFFGDLSVTIILVDIDMSKSDDARSVNLDMLLKPDAFDPSKLGPYFPQEGSSSSETVSNTTETTGKIVIEFEDTGSSSDYHLNVAEANQSEVLPMQGPENNPAPVTEVSNEGTSPAFEVYEYNNGQCAVPAEEAAPITAENPALNPVVNASNVDNGVCKVAPVTAVSNEGTSPAFEVYEYNNGQCAAPAEEAAPITVENPALNPVVNASNVDNGVCEVAPVTAVSNEGTSPAFEVYEYNNGQCAAPADEAAPITVENPALNPVVNVSNVENGVCEVAPVTAVSNEGISPAFEVYEYNNGQCAAPAEGAAPITVENPVLNPVVNASNVDNGVCEVAPVTAVSNEGTSPAFEVFEYDADEIARKEAIALAYKLVQEKKPNYVDDVLAGQSLPVVTTDFANGCSIEDTPARELVKYKAPKRMAMVYGQNQFDYAGSKLSLSVAEYIEDNVVRVNVLENGKKVASTVIKQGDKTAKAVYAKDGLTRGGLIHTVELKIEPSAEVAMNIVIKDAKVEQTPAENRKKHVQSEEARRQAIAKAALRFV